MKRSQNEFEFFIPEFSEVEIPFVGDIACGFPSPAEDFVQESIDLNKILIKHPEATFCARANGSSLYPLVLPGSILVIDKSEEWSADRLAACYVDGEFTAKWIRKEEGKISLIPFNTDFPVLEYKDGSEVMIWGIVIAIINQNVRFSRLQ